MRKNVSGQAVGAQCITAADGTAFTGSVTCYVTLNGGTQAIGTVGSGAATHEGNGFQTYAPSQAETNGDHIGYTFIGTGMIPVTVQVYPTFPQTGDNFARIGAAGAGLTAVPWNASWDAEVQSEVNDGLVAFWTSPATLVDLVWDEVITGAAHNANNSAAKFLRQSATATVGVTGTAQAGGASTITLDTGASAVNELYSFEQLSIIEGTGAGQARLIVTYVGSTKVATVDRPWTVAPDATSVYAIRGADAAVEAINGRLVTATGTVNFDNLASILTDTGTTIPAQISALNNLSAAQVNAEVDTALADYDAPTKAELDAGFAALNDFDPAVDVVANVTLVDTCTTNTDMRGTDSAYTGTPPTAGAIADQVWEEAIADHSGVSGSTAEALAAAGSAGDPWTTALPGSYTGTQAGKILADVLADTGTDGVAISATTANQLADAVLNRDMSAVSDTNSRTLLNAIRLLRNKWGSPDGTLTVTKEDDVTTAWTSELSSDAAADPVTGSDPT